MSPLISIILPVKNAAPWLNECLQSICAQSLPNWECIVIDDHSTDDSMKIVSGYSFFDARFVVRKNDGKGLIDADCAGLNFAKGEFITRMDADDIMPQNRLQWMSTLLQKSKPKTIITGKVEFFPKQHCGPGTLFYQNWLNGLCDEQNHWDWIWRECVLPSPCWLARRNEFEEMGGFNALEYPEDYDLAFRFWKNDFKVVSVLEICHLWRQHSARFSRTSELYSAERFMKLKWKYFEEFERNKFQRIILLDTGDKAKILAKLMVQKNIAFHWLTPFENMKGNKLNNMKVEYLFDLILNENDAVISTLSTIDNFEKIYLYLKEKNVVCYRFC